MPRVIHPRVRRILQAVLYETLAVAFVAPVLVWVFGTSGASAIGLSLTMSAIALGWNYIYNTLFERWERRQPVRGRSWQRRVVHGIGFEGGLALILVPVMALWLGITWWAAFLADLGILLFFFIYTVVFTWAFDKVFGLPQSSLRPPV